MENIILTYRCGVFDTISTSIIGYYITIDANQVYFTEEEQTLINSKPESEQKSFALSLIPNHS